MIFSVYLISSLFLLILISNYFIKKKILLNQTGDNHQKLSTKIQVPLTGGFFILLSILFYLNQYEKIFIISILLIFILGVFSDMKIINSASYKVLLQILIVVSFVYFSNLKLYGTRVLIIDELLENNFFNIAFVTFCILVVLNGSNFIDGMNTLVLGYFLIIAIILFKLNYHNGFNFEINDHLMIIYFMIILFFFNIKSKIFLGDSGTYLIGFLFSIILIQFYFDNPLISPFFIVLLLWYPCYENLFSIIRKFKFKRSPMDPDRNHLHQLIFIFLRKKFKLSINISNNYTSYLINSFNLIIFFLASLIPSHTQGIIFYIVLCIFLYTFVFLKLISLKLSKKI